MDAKGKDLAASVACLRTLGTGAQQAASGADARLSDSRAPTDASVTVAKLAAPVNAAVALSLYRNCTGSI